jgi:hypothetical protein
MIYRRHLKQFFQISLQPCHNLLHEIKGLHTSYNPISLKGIVHANLLSAEFIAKVNDEAYPDINNNI